MLFNTNTGISLPLKSNQCSLSLDKLYKFVSPCFIGLKWYISVFVKKHLKKTGLKMFEIENELTQ